MAEDFGKDERGNPQNGKEGEGGEWRNHDIVPCSGGTTVTDTFCSDFD
jgi:hypothetical protein